jgi:hypothetical protein
VITFTLKNFRKKEVRKLDLKNAGEIPISELNEHHQAEKNAERILKTLPIKHKEVN